MPDQRYAADQAGAAVAAALQLALWGWQVAVAGPWAWRGRSASERRRDVRFALHRIGLATAALQCFRAVDPHGVRGVLPYMAVGWASRNVTSALFLGVLVVVRSVALITYRVRDRAESLPGRWAAVLAFVAVSNAAVANVTIALRWATESVLLTFGLHLFYLAACEAVLGVLFVSSYLEFRAYCLSLRHDATKEIKEGGGGSNLSLPVCTAEAGPSSATASCPGSPEPPGSPVQPRSPPLRGRFAARSVSSSDAGGSRAAPSDWTTRSASGSTSVASSVAAAAPAAAVAAGAASGGGGGGKASGAATAPGSAATPQPSGETVSRTSTASSLPSSGAWRPSFDENADAGGSVAGGSAGGGEAAGRRRASTTLSRGRAASAAQKRRDDRVDRALHRMGRYLVMIVSVAAVLVPATVLIGVQTVGQGSWRDFDPDPSEYRVRGSLFLWFQLVVAALALWFSWVSVSRADAPAATAAAVRRLRKAAGCPEPAAADTSSSMDLPTMA